jgi:hypothetical protein
MEPKHILDLFKMLNTLSNIEGKIKIDMDTANRYINIKIQLPKIQLMEEKYDNIKK